MSTAWAPDSWRERVAAQQPRWPDEAALEASLKQLHTLPPLVFAGEARALTADLAQVADGKAILLQAGDCAESFDSFSADGIRDRLKVILPMAIVLSYSSGVPTVKVGRIAGQFAKPRSSDTEVIGDLEIPSFRGHIVNDIAPTEAARVPNPRSEEHTSELQSLMRISYAVFCLKKKKQENPKKTNNQPHQHI